MSERCSKCNREFKENEIKIISKGDLLEISVTPEGLDAAIVVKEKICESCYEEERRKPDEERQS